MSDLEYIKEKVDKMDTKIDTLLLSSVENARIQGEHEGRIKGHSTQISWLWGLLATGLIGGILSMLRSII